MSSSETDARKAGGRPRLSRQVIKRRREEIYRLHLAGMRESEIADSLHLSQSSVSEAIKSVRAGSSWFDKTARDRFADVIDKTRDMALATIAESWKMYLSPALADKPAVRALFMGRVQSGIKILAGFAPDAEALWVQETLEFVKGRQDEALAMSDRVQQLESERDLKSRVLRVSPKGD